jgi:Ankyrin repeats (many copies)/UvrD-like helicase C-terminal domain
MMTILLHNELNTTPVKRQFDKVLDCLQKGDFRSADVKKMQGTAYYRAKLDDTHRLLFQFGRYDGQTYLLILEVILNHDYANSRFLRGAVVDETKLHALHSAKDIQEDPLSISHVNKQTGRFHLLDKILSFDDVQDDVYQMSLPIIMIGSAGSGKTALTLEKMKRLTGNILYVTLSDFLIENARKLYYSFGYDNERQNTTFLSFKDFMSTIQITNDKEMTFKIFDDWINKYKHTYKIRNNYKVFEEFKGVITGSVVERAYLNKDEYIHLGIKQSVFLQEERAAIYELFVKYLAFLKEKGYCDMNIEAYQNLAHVQPTYDYVVIDEVQDLTNVQLFLILKALKDKGQFMLCGDANQIVHPNFFSWTHIKTLFHQQHTTTNKDIVRILGTNYRNTPQVTALANQLLLVKNARFGSIDRESTYLVKTNSAVDGETLFYEDTPSVKKALNQHTSRSTKFAVLVMRQEDKAEASQYFDTPLIFSVQEAKGLEYDNIILYNIISNHEKPFKELTIGVTKEDLQQDLTYHRNRDKSDKSLEVYKFYINSLYVAVTRAVKNLYVIEKASKHALLELLDLTDFRQQVQMNNYTSSLAEWQKEAQKLDKQGKQEQADAIRKSILKQEDISWEVVNHERLATLKIEALNPEIYHKKAKDQLFEFAAFYDDTFWMPQLAKLKYKHAQPQHVAQEQKAFLRHTLNDYYHNNLKALLPLYQKYGVNFRNIANLTPLMLATRAGADQVVAHLIANGADLKAVDSFGRTAFQIALQESAKDPNYAKTTLAKVYPLLKPTDLKIRMHRHLLTFDDAEGLFFMLNFMMGVLRNKLTKAERGKMPFWSVDDFLEAFKSYPPSVVAPNRRQRAYISGLLSKHALGTKGKNRRNLMLFMRVNQGQYLLNPLIEIEVGEDEWVYIYDLLGLEELEASSEPYFNHLAKIIQSLKDMLSDVMDKAAQELEEKMGEQEATAETEEMEETNEQAETD